MFESSESSQNGTKTGSSVPRRVASVEGETLFRKDVDPDGGTLSGFLGYNARMDAIEETIARVIETLDAGTDETLDPDATLHPMLFGKERAAGPRTLDLDGLLVLVGVFVVAALGLPLGFLAPLAIVAIIVMIFALRRINAQHKSAGS